MKPLIINPKIINLETVKPEIEKLSPQENDVIFLKFEEEIFNGDFDEQLNNISAEIKEDFPGIHIIMTSKTTDLNILTEKNLKLLGLKRIK